MPKSKKTNMSRALTRGNTRHGPPGSISRQIDQLTRKAEQAQRNRGATDLGVDRLEDSYRRKIDFALGRQGIRGKAREKLVRWREEGMRQICPKPEPLFWLQEQAWKSLYRSLRVAAVFAVCATDKHPDAVTELYTEIGRLMEPFRGRRTKPEISGILAETVKLREKGWSWLKIAQRLCPDRNPNHSCDKICADRIRVAAQRLAKTKQIGTNLPRFCSPI